MSATLQIDFDHDFQQKLMQQRFGAGSVLHDAAAVRAWRQLWMAQLSSWHTPYKALIDCQHLTVGKDAQLEEALATLVAFMQKLFLRKAVGFNRREGCNHDLLPFAVLVTEAEARQELGLRTRARARGDDLRSQIAIQNHFRQQVVELSFSVPFVLDDDNKLAVLKSKLTNNLMQWHAKWSLLIDCSNFSIDATQRANFAKLESFLRRYFLQKIVGYNRKGVAQDFPFSAFRAKHKAALQLERDTAVAGDEAHCRTKTT